MSEPTSEFCAAYGCPLIGVYGNGGKWYCCCHRNVDAGNNDAVTLNLGSHQALVDRALMLRRTHGHYADILAAENDLIELTRQAGEQRHIPTAPVIGPTHAAHHHSETEQ